MASGTTATVWRSIPVSTATIQARRSRPIAPRRARNFRSWRRASHGRSSCATPGRLGPSPGIPPSPLYPLAANFNSGVSLFHPNFRTPFARSFSVGLQRTLTRQMAVEVRYVGTRLVDGTATENWNEINWTTNGFLDGVQARAGQPAGEHRAARPRELVCLFRSGHRARRRCRSTWRISTAAPRATPATPPLYTGTNWTNTARLAELALRNPNPGAARRTRCSPPPRSAASMLTAGYPQQLLRAQPGRQQRPGPDQRRIDELRLAAGDAAPRAVGRPRHRRELRVCRAATCHA